MRQGRGADELTMSLNPRAAPSGDDGDEDFDEAQRDDDVPLAEHQKKRCISFLPRKAPLAVRLWQMLNTAFLGLLPLFVCILIPAPDSQEDEKMFWHETAWLVLVTGLGLGSSVLFWLIRTPCRYSVSRSRLHIVSAPQSFPASCTMV